VEVPVSDQNRKLYEELGDLARYIEQTMHGFQNLQQPIEAASHQLPQAAEHLSDLRKMSEEATHTVMGQTEAIQDNHGRLLAALNGTLSKLSQAGIGGPLTDELQAMRQLLNDDEKRLVEIFTALSFQDLLAQRVNKLVTVLADVEHKLLELLVIFGSQHPNGQQRDQSKTGDMLKWLEASKTTALKQDLVDDVLEQLGFG
jgi:chemotaxis protein CheZ